MPGRATLRVTPLYGDSGADGGAAGSKPHGEGSKPEAQAQNLPGRQTLAT